MENLESLLKELAQELGTTTEFLWGVLIRQAQVEIVEAVIAAVASIILLFVTYKIIRSLLPRWDDIEGNGVYELAFVTVICGLGIASIFITVDAIGRLIELPTLLYNPEYWALQQILEAVGR